MNKQAYVARDRNSSLYLYWQKPRKALEQGMWVSQGDTPVALKGEDYPQLKDVSWSDDAPVMVMVNFILEVVS